jgi:hypothetical protein
MTRIAFDFSNWTDVPTDADCATLKTLGYTTGIVGASFNPGLARQQLAALVAHGFRVEVYAWLRHPWQVALLASAIDACAGFPVERIWLDVEDAEDATGKTPDQLAFDVEQALAYLRGRFDGEVGIYTGDWFWDQYMQTTNTFGCRLWLANYVPVPVALPPLPGGWVLENLVIWQWQNHLSGTAFNADDDLILQEEDRMKYTDAKLDAIFPAILTTLAQALDLANAAGNAISNHINTHPGGGATITQAGELQPLNDKINAYEAELTAFKAAVAAAAVVPAPVVPGA